MSIQRLKKGPNLLGHHANFTCDSDRNLARFTSNGQAKPQLDHLETLPRQTIDLQS